MIRDVIGVTDMTPGCGTAKYAGIQDYSALASQGLAAVLRDLDCFSTVKFIVQIQGGPKVDYHSLRRL